MYLSIPIKKITIFGQSLYKRNLLFDFCIDYQTNTLDAVSKETYNIIQLYKFNSTYPDNKFTKYYIEKTKTHIIIKFYSKMSESIDRYITTIPADNYQDFCELVIDRIDDTLYDNDTDWFDYSETCYKWLNKLFYKDYTIKNSADIIQRGYKLYKK